MKMQFFLKNILRNGQEIGAVQVNGGNDLLRNKYFAPQRLSFLIKPDLLTGSLALW